MIKAAILGASGYTGLELLRILSGHPDVLVVEAASRQYKGRAITEVFPFLAGFYDGLEFSGAEGFKGTSADIVFCALPHGASMEAVPALLKGDKKVVDLSADFRFSDPAVYEKWYEPHKAKGLLKDAVYGLPELMRAKIHGASLVANPGCYPTGALLALAPLVRSGLIDLDSIIIDSKSGASGAGRQATVEHSFVEVNNAFKPYKVGNHRHGPEIEQGLGYVSGKATGVTFTPHLLPVSRGILTTAYATLSRESGQSGIHKLYADFYKGEPFIRLMPEGRFPDVSQVRGANFCDIGVFVDPGKRRVIIVSAIDNLVKGASGQAVQNMNIMFGLKEETALRAPGLAY